MANGVGNGKRLTVPFMHCSGFSSARETICEMYSALEYQKLHSEFLSLVNRIVKV